MFNFNISKTTIYTQVCCGYLSLGRLCWLGFRGSLHWICYRRVFHVYASSVRCPFVFLFFTLDIPDAPRIVYKKLKHILLFRQATLGFPARWTSRATGTVSSSSGQTSAGSYFLPSPGLSSSQGLVESVSSSWLSVRSVFKKTQTFFLYKFTSSQKDNSVPHLINPDAVF